MKWRHREGARALAAAALAIAAVGGCTLDSAEPSFDNPLDPVLGQGLPIPDSVRVLVGDNVVSLSWGLPAEETAEEYAVFRRRTDSDAEEPERLLERVTVSRYTDTRVMSGRAYAYRLAAGRGGRFGERTEEIAVRPGLFAVVIADDREFTRQREVAVSSPVSSALALRLSEDPSHFAGPWLDAGEPALWTLSAGDGVKTVYASFRLADGVESLPVFDTILLDTKAAIRSVTFEGADVRRPGEAVRFLVDAQETQGAATITIDGVFDEVPLFDDGTAGDLQADDGVYSRSITLPGAALVLEAEVEGDFVDAAGNRAGVTPAARLLTIQEAPDPVELLTAEAAPPPDRPAVTLRWSVSQEESFSVYRLFRADSAPVDSSARQVERIGSATTTEYTDQDVIEGQTYHYRLYVESAVGLLSGSNTRMITVPNARTPDAVTLAEPTATSTTTVALSWSASAERDFAAYRLFRNQTGAVSDGDDLVSEATDAGATSWDDTGLRENTTYHYRVYVRDRGGLSTRSNEIDALTDNVPPPAVSLHAPSNVESTAATLTWDASSVHDFAFYRLYRDEISTVTTSSELVVEMDDRTFTSFRDRDLESDTRYYYRVFVIDDAPEPDATGSNTVMLDTP